MSHEGYKRVVRALRRIAEARRMGQRTECDCGAGLPMHLAGLVTEHTCSCRKVWTFRDGGWVSTGMGINPFADYDDAHPVTKLGDDLQKTGGPVVHPEHYNACGEKDEDGSVKYEPIKVIEAWGWVEGFCFGCALKYILRAPHKGSERADLEKAVWYLERLMARDFLAVLERDEDCDMEAVDVAAAWDLSENLMMAVEWLSMSNPTEAVKSVKAHLAKE